MKRYMLLSSLALGLTAVVLRRVILKRKEARPALRAVPAAPKDIVEEASLESFPASDPPAW